MRTGVTAILPRGRGPEIVPVWAGFWALNGNGEMTGSHRIRDGGHFAGPVVLTSTHSVGIAHHAATGWMIDSNPAFAAGHVRAMPVLAETHAGLLNDINGRHVTEAHVCAALDAAGPGPVPMGSVGGGTGMIAYEFGGGTGSASRRVGGWTLGARVRANHGRRDRFTVPGRPVGPHPGEDRLLVRDQGSIIVVLATDAPMMPHQLHRLARRAGPGLGRGGSPGGNSSGDIFLAFSTANPVPRAAWEAGGVHPVGILSAAAFDPFCMAAVEAVEEAVLDAMRGAEDAPTPKPPG